MAEEREQIAAEDREALDSDEVEGHQLAQEEREAVDSGDDVEGHSMDPGSLDSGNVRAE